MHDAGWIKLHRKALKSAVSQDLETFGLWCQLLLRANWERRQLLNGQWLEPGQLIIGQTKFSKEIGLTRDKLRYRLNLLESCANITQQTHNKGTTITICNWGTYQQLEETESPANPQPIPNQSPTSPQPVPTEEEVKKRRRGEGEPTLTPRFKNSKCVDDLTRYHSFLARVSRTPLQDQAWFNVLKRIDPWSDDDVIEAIRYRMSCFGDEQTKPLTKPPDSYRRQPNNQSDHEGTALGAN